MKMKKNLGLLLILIMGSFDVVFCQTQSDKKPKPYDAWVKTPSFTYKGTLYDVQDSSIRITNSLNYNFSSFRFQDIDAIQIRKKNSVVRGVIVGGIIGLLPSIVLAASLDKNDDGLYLLLVPMVGMAGAGVGAVVGAGLGSIRITIPIERKKENFDAYKGKLNYFALKDPSSAPTSAEVTAQSKTWNYEISPTPMPVYEHESFIGLGNGPSFLMGDLANDFLINGRNYRAKTGYSGNWLNIGYRLKKNMGITFVGFENQYETQSGDPEEWWSINGFLIGPMYTYPVSRRFLFDLKPRIGYANGSLNTDINAQVQGNGLVINPCISIRYNFARRWCAFSEAGYMYSSQKLDEIGKVNFSLFNLGLGIAYRYK